MEYIEAHKILEERQRTLTGHYGVRSTDEKLIEANGLAILAVEKQIPKRATIKREGKTLDAYCAACGSVLGILYIARDIMYCPECGQKLLWGGT